MPKLIRTRGSHANADGASWQSPVPGVVLAALMLAAVFAFAPSADAYIYWANQGPVGDPGTTIGRAHLDGSGVNQAFITGTSAPCGVAVNDTHIYWGTRPGLAETEAGSIGRANLDGTGVQNDLVATPIVNPCGVALGPSHVYWAQRSPLNDAVGRADLDGGNPLPAFIDPDFTEESVTGVAVNATHIFWVSFGIEPDTGAVGRADLNGSNPNSAFVSPGAAVGSPMAVAVDSTHIYWANQWGRSIGRANIDGSEPDKNFIEDADEPCGVAVDATHVYWTNPGAGAIGRANLDGTDVDHSFITGATHPCGVAVDALSPPNDFSFGTVKKNKKRGTATLEVRVPGPGTLELAKSKQLRRARKRAEAAGKARLRVIPTRKVKKRLSNERRARVRARVTYRPDGGEANTKVKQVKLVKRA